MKLYKVIIIVIFLTTIATVGYIIINKQNKNYIIISKDDKEQIKSVMDECKNLKPDLQSSDVLVSWVEDQDEQMRLMNDILGSLTILGESKNERPKQYYKAAYFTNQAVFLYIEKLEQHPHKRIIIEMNNRLYTAKANKEPVNAVIKYLKAQGVY